MVDTIRHLFADELEGVTGGGVAGAAAGAGGAAAGVAKLTDGAQSAYVWSLQLLLPEPNGGCTGGHGAWAWLCA